MHYTATYATINLMNSTESADFYSEVALRLGVSRSRVAVALAAAEQLDEEAFDLVEKLLEIDPALESAKRRALCQGWVDAASWCSGEYEDPLAELDEPMEVREAAAAMVWAETEAHSNRSGVLRESIGVAQAARLTGRSRQAIEKQRRAGRLLALRVGRQWRYPAWQFDPDGTGSVLAGLPEVIEALAMSPVAAAVWLTTPRSELEGDPPIRRLLSGGSEPVLRLARQHGRLA